MNNAKKFLIFLIVLSAALLLLVLNFKEALGVFPWLWHLFEALVIGGCIAYVVNIIMDWLSSKVFTETRILNEKLRKTLNIVFSYLIILIAGVIIIWIMIPQLVESFKMLYQRIPTVLEAARSFLESHASASSALQGLLADIKNHSHSISSSAVTIVKNALPKTFAIASNGVHFVMNIVIALVFSIYLLLSKRVLASQARELCYAFLPKKAAIKTLYIFHLLYRNFRDFIYGRFVDALCMAIMYLACALIFRIPYTLMITTIIAVFCLIPLFGALIAWIIGLFLIVTVSPVKAIIFTAAIVVIMLFARNVIYPRVIGSSIGLPDLWVLAAVVVGGKMLGLLGMIIAVPVFGVIYTLIEDYTEKRVKVKEIDSREYMQSPDWKDYNAVTNDFEESKKN